jgi:CBS domain-containing protein
MSVGALCNREVVVTTTDTSVAEAAQLMRRFHVGDLVILDEEEMPAGLVTDRDIVVEVVAQALDPEAISVADIMTRSLETVTAATDFWDALHHMRQHGIRRIPVVSDTGKLEGILTLDDALELLSEALSDLVGLVSREIEQEETTRPER